MKVSGIKNNFSNNNNNNFGGGIMKNGLFFLVAMIAMLACGPVEDEVTVNIDQEGTSSGVHKVINYNLKACYLPEYGGAACPPNYYCQYDFDVSDYVCLGVCYVEFKYEEYVDVDKDYAGEKEVKDLYKVLDTCAEGWHCYVPKKEMKKVYVKDVYVGEEGKGVCQKNTQCVYNSDCGMHEMCYDSQCVPMEERCDEDIDCDGGEVCSADGWCVTAAGETDCPDDKEECYDDADCLDGETCEDGKCVDEKEEPDMPVTGETLKCTFECAKSGYRPLVWYGEVWNKDGKFLETNPGSFSADKCEVCTWGPVVEFHYNCYSGDSDSPDDWGYGYSADVSCSFDGVDVDPELSSLGGGKMKALFDNIDCTACWN